MLLKDQATISDLFAKRASERPTLGWLVEVAGPTHSEYADRFAADVERLASRLLGDVEREDGTWTIGFQDENRAEEFVENLERETTYVNTGFSVHGPFPMEGSEFGETEEVVGMELEVVEFEPEEKKRTFEEGANGTDQDSSGWSNLWWDELEYQNFGGAKDLLRQKERTK